MRHWRWIVVVGGVASLLALPVVMANRPAQEPGIGVAEITAAVAASDTVAHQGLYESHGSLRLPDLGRFDDEVAPFAGTSRVRVFYAAPDRWRADELLIGAERGVYREPDGLWLWDSGTRRVVHSPRGADEPYRIPRLMDLSPAELGRRLLAESEGDTLESIPARRVAGIVAAGVRIVPASTTTTVAAVDLWVDPDSGLVVGLEIGTGDAVPAFETAFVDLALHAPADEVVQFDADEAGEPVREAPTVDPVENVAALGLIELPAELAGLPRRSETSSGLATYGSGMSVVTMVAAPPRTLGRPGRGIFALPTSQRSWGGEATVVETSLVNVELLGVGGYDVVLAGTVTVAELDRIAGELVEAGVL